MEWYKHAFSAFIQSVDAPRDQTTVIVQLLILKRRELRKLNFIDAQCWDGGADEM